MDWRMRWGVLWMVAMAALGLAAPAADAAPFTPQMDLAYRLAVEYWGGPPAHCAEVNREIVSGFANPHELGRATIPGSVAIRCHVYLVRGLDGAGHFGLMCTIMVHEVGHLEGLHHSKDPSSPMYPVPRPQPFCVGRQRLLVRIDRLRRDRTPGAERLLHRAAHRFWSPLRRQRRFAAPTRLWSPASRVAAGAPAR